MPFVLRCIGTFITINSVSNCCIVHCTIWQWCIWLWSSAKSTFFESSVSKHWFTWPTIATSSGLASFREQGVRIASRTAWTTGQMAQCFQNGEDSGTDSWRHSQPYRKVTETSTSCKDSLLITWTAILLAETNVERIGVKPGGSELSKHIIRLHWLTAIRLQTPDSELWS